MDRFCQGLKPNIGIEVLKAGAQKMPEASRIALNIDSALFGAEMVNFQSGGGFAGSQLFYVKHGLCGFYKKSSQTRFHSLYIELDNSLEFHEEAKAQSAANRANDDIATLDERMLGSKPELLFTAPRYANKIPKVLLPGCDQERSCSNCGNNGHRFPNFRLSLNAAIIGARKAKFYEKKTKNKNATRRIFRTRLNWPWCLSKNASLWE